MTTVNKGALIGVLAALLFFVGLTNVEGQNNDFNDFNRIQSPEYVSTHGSACQAANLAQAINFNATWNIQGVSNPNPIGSGRSFYVTCPLTLIDDQTDQTGADAFIYKNPALTGTGLTCSGFRWREDDVATTAAVAGTDFGEFIEIVDIVADSDVEFNGVEDSVSILCSLPPQTGIRSIHFDSD